LIAFCNAQLAPGAETIIGLLGYEQSVQGADILITGEGKLDAQTRGGKGVQAAADLALRNHVPAIALVGTLDCTPADLVAMNLDAAFSILPHPCTLEEATAHAAEWLSATATQVGNLLAAWQK
jgi:glycerate kinase